MSKTNRTILIAILIVIVVGLIIYFAVKANKVAAPTVGQESATSSLSSSSSTPATSTAPGESVTGTVATATSSATTFSDASFSFTYPASWTISTRWPISIDNFGGNYPEGGVLPSGGAEFDAVTTTVYNNLPAIMQTELMGETDVSTSTIAVSGVSCVQAHYYDDYSVGLSLNDISIYCPQGTELWKIYFDYRSNDSAGAAHLAVFQNILASMKLR